MVPPAQAGQDLLSVLRDKLKLSGKQAKALLDRRDVFVNGQRVWMAKHKLRAGDRLEVQNVPTPAAPGKAVAPVPVVYEDTWLVAVNKPAGIVSDRDPKSVESLLRQQLSLPRLRALHRLDKDTTGVMLLTREEAEREPYVDLFRNHQLEKTYQAVVQGFIPDKHFVIDKRLDNKEAVTRVTVLRGGGGYAWISCEIPTGRTHQIRRHLQVFGLRIVGDRQYGAQGDVPEVERAVPHHLLHAAALAFRCPHRNEPVNLSAPPPPAFRIFLNAVGFSH